MGPRMHSVGRFIAFFDAQEGRKGGFRVPRECRGATDPPGMFRFREENDCFGFLRVRLGSESGLL